MGIYSQTREGWSVEVGAVGADGGGKGRRLARGGGGIHCLTLNCHEQTDVYIQMGSDMNQICSFFNWGGRCSHQTALPQCP